MNVEHDRMQKKGWRETEKIEVRKNWSTYPAYSAMTKNIIIQFILLFIYKFNRRPE